MRASSTRTSSGRRTCFGHRSPPCIGGMGARGVSYHHEVFAPMGYEARPPPSRINYLAGDEKAAIAGVPTAMAGDVTLIGSWAKIAGEIQWWQRPSPPRSASTAACVTGVKLPASCGADVGAVLCCGALTRQWW